MMSNQVTPCVSFKDNDPPASCSSTSVGRSAAHRHAQRSPKSQFSILRRALPDLGAGRKDRRKLKNPPRLDTALLQLHSNYQQCNQHTR